MKVQQSRQRYYTSPSALPLLIRLLTAGIAIIGAQCLARFMIDFSNLRETYIAATSLIIVYSCFVQRHFRFANPQLP